MTYTIAVILGMVLVMTRINFLLYYTFQSPVISFVPQIGSQTSIPISPNLVLKIPFLDLKYPYSSTILRVTVSPPEMLLNLDVIDGRIDVPVPIKAV